MSKHEQQADTLMQALTYAYKQINVLKQQAKISKGISDECFEMLDKKEAEYLELSDSYKAIKQENNKQRERIEALERALAIERGADA